LKEEYKVVIKYAIEIEGLPVYTESYDAEKLRKEVQADEPDATRVLVPPR
jgi:hypothetical protein